MEYRWVYTGCDAEDERTLAAHWEDLQPGWDARLKALDRFPDDATISIVHRAQETPAWSAQATLVFPGEVIAEEAESLQARTALEELVNRLSRRVDELQDRPEGRVQRRRGIEGVVPFLEQAWRSKRMNGFAAFLRPILTSFRQYARRELAMHEIEGDVAEGELEVEELLDEALLRAWDHFDQRPGGLALDAWLAGLIGQALEEQAAAANNEVSLDETVRAEPHRPFDAESSRDSWVEQPAASDAIALADLLPGRPAPDAWEQLDSDHRQAGLNRVLARLTREQRQSLLLSAVHGLAAAEIAAIQGEGISSGQAQAAVEAGRDSLTRLIDDEEVWTDFQEEFERHRHDPLRRT
ncbi:MAG: hypothetical protein DWQ34_24055 [Planctomycetota bacterium]|nr:MAG: hypothetical protein DWQ34_24055 [Planctomycetota bacterium]REK27807.1 MAG: hypothetical protein DWQ41_06805 [Planctomycetota bacterium]REK40261.1 MAG: hypothetical protein DWQ45_00045 [Planctomycetota bacterium]